MLIALQAAHPAILIHTLSLVNVFNNNKIIKTTTTDPTVLESMPLGHLQELLALENEKYSKQPKRKSA